MKTIHDLNEDIHQKCCNDLYNQVNYRLWDRATSDLRDRCFNSIFDDVAYLIDDQTCSEISKLLLLSEKQRTL